MITPILLFAYGNPSRGDDALGPMLMERIEQHPLSQRPLLECLTDMQLQVEHIMDIQQRSVVLFVDADIACPAPYQLHRLQIEKDDSYTSHAMSAAALLYAFTKVFGTDAPPAYILRIRGYDFELGQALSKQAQANLKQATIMVEQLCLGQQPSIMRTEMLDTDERVNAADRKTGDG